MTVGSSGAPSLAVRPAPQGEIRRRRGADPALIFHETPIAGALLVESEARSDERGFFARPWCERSFAAQEIHGQLVQANISFNRVRGTLRGLHYQVAPHAEAKLVRCTRGAIFDVVADLRPDSPTCGQWYGAELTADNRKALYVPEGCAHGFQTLMDETEAFYQVSADYCPDAERGFRWNDPAFGIEWPQPDPPAISDKDLNWPDFRPGSVADAWRFSG